MRAIAKADSKYLLKQFDRWSHLWFNRCRAGNTGTPPQPDPADSEGPAIPPCGSFDAFGGKFLHSNG